MRFSSKNTKTWVMEICYPKVFSPIFSYNKFKVVQSQKFNTSGDGNLPYFGIVRSLCIELCTF